MDPRECMLPGLLARGGFRIFRRMLVGKSWLRHDREHEEW